MAETTTKPLSAAQIKDLEKDGHKIGKPAQALSEAHDKDTIVRWERWEIELRMKVEMRGKDRVGMPYEFYALKKLRENIVGGTRTFQEMNKQVDYRLIGRPNHQVFLFPAGTVQVGKTYTCGTWWETTGHGPEQIDIERIYFTGIEEATGAPKKS